MTGQTRYGGYLDTLYPNGMGEVEPGLKQEGEIEPGLVEEGGEEHPTTDHTHFIERLKHGAMVSRIIGEAMERGAEGFGDAPIGFVPGGDADKFMQRIGLFRDPEQARFGDTLRLAYEATLKPAAGLIDAVMRGFSAGTHGLGGAAGQAYFEAGGEQGMAERLKRDVTGMLDVGLLLSGDPQFARVGKLPNGIAHDEPIGGMPKAGDFQPIARAIAEKAPEGAADAAAIEAKLTGLYQEHGIHPAEVLADMQTDPRLLADITSDHPVLPSRYTGFDPEAAKAADAAAAARAAAPPKQIPGVSPQLSHAIQPQLSWPQATPSGVPGTTMTAASRTFGGQVSSLIDRWGLGDIVRDLQLKTTPMAVRDATVESRAVVKDFANTMRVADTNWRVQFKALTKELTPDQLRDMYLAVDAEDAAKIQGTAPVNGLASLPPNLRAITDQLRRNMKAEWDDAVTLGMVSGDGHEFYVPRMLNMVKGTEVEKFTPVGQTMRTTTNQLRERKYQFLAETEAAAKKLLGVDAEVVKDIRTLPLATAQLQRAIAGRRLIDEIKKLGKLTADAKGEGIAEPTVVEGAIPENSAYKWFTIEQHPAFWQHKPGQGRMPIYVRSDFEGPLRAVLRAPDGAIYNLLMEAKAKATSAIMYSPLLHNAVVFGRTMPAMVGQPGAVTGLPSVTGTSATLRLYMEGAKLRADLPQLREAVGYGMAPISREGARMDIGAMLPGSIAPGQSITAKIASAIPGFFDPKAGLAVKQAIDKAGDFWHNTLLWDRVADLQMGLYSHYREELLAKGYAPDTAGRAAAHLANRYAGALPLESMAQGSQKLANLLMFSRSYTLGNLGTMKDVFYGLPKDVLAQVERDQGIREMMRVKSWAQRKALGIVTADMALAYIGGSIAQSAISVLTTDKTLPEEAREYVTRWDKAMQRLAANPYEVMHPFAFLDSLTPNGENEPSKTHQIFVGYQSDGTAIYVRNPTGKVGEEFMGYLTAPSEMVHRKLSTLVRPAIDIFNNQDYAGRKIYNPYAETYEEQVRNAARIAMHYMAAQGPEGAIKAAWDLLTGTPTKDEAKIDTAQLLGPMVGLMFSTGAPGGPAIGELMKAKKEQEFAVQKALPDIRKAIKESRLEEAYKQMTELKIPFKLQNFFVQTTLNPEAAFTRKKAQELMGTLPEDQQARIRAMFERSTKR